MINCIFCDKPNEATSLEHIIPESLGNKTYLMEKSAVCDVCNFKFSDFEGKALTNSIFGIERARLGIVTKKGKSGKAKINHLEISGHPQFEKNKIYVSRLDSENLINYDESTGNGQLVFFAFDKSEASACKLALKIAMESIYTYNRKIFAKYDFKDLKGYLTNKNSKDWVFLITDFENEKFESIPKRNVKYDLKIKNHCELKLLEIDENNLLFRFRFGSISMMLNLINRGIDWTFLYVQNDELIQIYPKHYKGKIEARQLLYAKLVDDSKEISPD